MQKIKNLFRSSESRNGSYSVGITALVIAIIVIVNLIAGQNSGKNIKIWMSAVKKFMRFPRPAKSCSRTWITK